MKLFSAQQLGGTSPDALSELYSELVFPCPAHGTVVGIGWALPLLLVKCCFPVWVSLPSLCSSLLKGEPEAPSIHRAFSGSS